MGTNFYWHDRPCTHCKRFERVHVGKRSLGWSFGFRAWPHRLLNDEHPDWGYAEESPVGFTVSSRADWRRVFTDRTGELFDEYGQRVDDPIAWLDELAAPNLGQQTWENTETWRYSRPDSRQHRDAEGFRFWAGEFS